MNLLSGLLGNASEANAQQIQAKYKDVLIPEEQVQAAFILIRDTFIFTNKRLILVDVQGTSGKKVEYLSVPYKSIKYFSVETAGTFDRDAELKIWVSNSHEPTISKEIKKGIDVVGLQRTLAYFVMN
ncbi:MAG: PH domain-containing protein [Chloroflexi bacterium]|nr:PH domain-containing protein [Chloroflexota bacterium]